MFFISTKAKVKNFWNYVYRICIFVFEMKLYNIYLPEKLKAKMEREMSKHGFTKLAPFIRFIIAKFFEK